MASLDPVPDILRDEVEFAVRKEKAPGFDSITGGQQESPYSTNCATKYGGKKLLG